MIGDGDCGSIVGMKIGRGNRSTRRKPAPAPLCPTQAPYDQTRDRTRAAETNRLSYGTVCPMELVPRKLIGGSEENHTKCQHDIPSLDSDQNQANPAYKSGPYRLRQLALARHDIDRGVTTLLAFSRHLLLGTVNVCLQDILHIEEWSVGQVALPW
jgi:hypothetical protein